MEKIGYKTFASQFISENKSDDVFTRLVEIVKNGITRFMLDRLDLLAAIGQGKEEVRKRDEGGKNLLFYAAYSKADMCLLYLLRVGLNYKDIDAELKNIYHLICYSGSIGCLENLTFFLKLTKLQKLNESLLETLNRYGYKRTDMKNGKLKYSVSAKRESQFKDLQKEATQLYTKYLHNYLEEISTILLEKEEKDQRNPVHLGCLNKFQKCLPTLEFLINSIQNPKMVLNYKLLTDFESINGYFDEKIDPRNYEDTIQCLCDILDIETKDSINKNYDQQAKKAIKDILNAKDKNDQSPLYIASKNGSTAMINFLQVLVPNTKLEEKQEIMKVALHNLARSRIIDLCEASKLGDTKPLNFLISCGESVNEKKTIFGTFALLEALKSFKTENSLETFRALIKSGADVNISDTNGWTVLHHAASLGYKEIVEYLLETAKENKLDPNKVTNKRYHALHLAGMNEHPEIIKMLIEHPNSKTNIDIADWDGCTALLHAAKKGSLNVLKTLLNLNANIYACDVRQMTALHHAAFSTHPACIRELLNFDSDFDKLREMRNSKGKLPKDLCTDSRPFENIFTSARTGNVNLIRKLTAEKPDIKDSTTQLKERTPLILAVIARSLVSVKFLIDNGADTYHEDKEGKSAGTYCEELLGEAKKKKKDENDIKVLEQIKRLLD